MLPTSVHGVAGSNPAGGEILLEPKRRFIAQSLSCSPFHRLEMTEIQVKGRKTLTHPSILRHSSARTCCTLLAAGAGWEDSIAFFTNLSCRSFPGRPLDMTAIMCYPLGRGRCQLLLNCNG